MLLLRHAAWMFSAATIVLATTGVSAQEYPNKPVRIITSAAGSGSDFVARLIAQGISGPLAQPVIVENRGSGVTTAEAVARMTPDGYTLLIDSNSLWVASLLQKPSYDAVRDFAPISLVIRTPYLLVVHPSLPASSVKELISLAKAKPGQLNFSSGPPGTSAHLAAELFKAIAGLNIVGVSYASNSQELSDLVSGRVQLTFWSGTKAIPLVKVGKLRPLAVTSSQPSALFPDLPTMAASGVPGYESLSITGMFAPAKTPPTIIHRLNQEIVRFLNQPEVKRKLLDSGIEGAGSSPEEFAAAINTEVTKWAKVIKVAGIRIE